MSTFSGISIYAPVLINDPYTIMGVSAQQGVFDVAYICTHEKINKWSRIKPIKHPSISPLSPSDFDNNTWGFTIPRMDDEMSEDFSEWIYNKLTPSDPKRLSDFATNNIRTDEINNYNKNADIPLDIFSGDISIDARSTNNGIFILSAIYCPGTSNILKNFKNSPLSKWHIGCKIFNSDHPQIARYYSFGDELGDIFSSWADDALQINIAVAQISGLVSDLNGKYCLFLHDGLSFDIGNNTSLNGRKCYYLPEKYGADWKKMRYSATNFQWDISYWAEIMYALSDLMPFNPSTLLTVREPYMYFRIDVDVLYLENNTDTFDPSRFKVSYNRWNPYTTNFDETIESLLDITEIWFDNRKYELGDGEYPIRPGLKIRDLTIKLKVNNIPVSARRKEMTIKIFRNDSNTSLIYEKLLYIYFIPRQP